MLSLTEIFVILICHWVFDFIMQSHYQATNKSKNNKALFEHVLTYSLAWFLVGILYLNINIFLPLDQYKELAIDVIVFTSITFICHFITDYFTSRLNTYLWNKKDVHNFFVSIGGDQLLHYFQLFLTYYLLK